MSTSSRVIRKRLDDDCLLDGGLHPSIAERLERVRELPMRNVANLRAVEVDPDGVWLVWQHVEGRSLEQVLSSPPPQERLDEIARDLTRAVRALHAHGMVHGALHARNVIVDSTGQVVLTHISPLLFSDPAQDQRALLTILAGLGHAAPGEGDPAEFDDSDDRSMRVRAYLLAGAAVLAGMVMFAGILWYIRA